MCKAILDWMEESRNEGGIQKIIALICKKLRKGKAIEVIADEVEEEVSFVQEIYEVAAQFAPEYDEVKVVEKWFEIKGMNM